MTSLVAVLFVIASAAAPAKANLAGTWRGDGFEIVLNADGSGTIKDSEASPAEPLKWTASGSSLTLIEDGEPVAYSFKLSGSTLHLSGGDLDEPVNLVRGAAARAQSAPESAAPTRPSGQATRHQGPGTCEGACRHYLKCAGHPELLPQCVMACSAEGYGADFMGWFQSLDCASAITVIAMLEAQSRGLQGGQGASQSKECDGCRWDGTSCAWYSQGNWGTNVAYSGAVITCDNACCGR